MKPFIALSSFLLLLGITLLGTSGTALAQGDEPADDDMFDDSSDDGMADDDGMEDDSSDDGMADEDSGMSDAAPGGTRLVLPAGQLLLEAFLEINLSKGSAFKPIALQPDIWYGVNNDLTVGFVHSPRAVDGFIAPRGPGAGLCLGSKDATDPMNPPSCLSTYSNAGLLARYHLLDSPVILAADGGLLFRDLDPFVLALKLGVVGEWIHSEKLLVQFGLNLAIGLTERDFNKEVLSIPVAVMYRVMPKLAAGIQTGLRTPFSELSDNFAIPLSLGVRYAATEKITVDASFSLPLLLTGVDDASGFAARILTLGGAYAF